MAKNSREDIIRKLLALRELMRRGGTEAESMNAAEKLATMAAKYNIELHELGEDECGTTVEEQFAFGKYNETWRKHCYEAASKMYFCHYFYRRTPRHREFAIKHCIVGEPHNVVVALEMGRFFEDTINRLGNEAARDNKHEVELSHTHRHRFIRSFRIAAADRLKTRVKEYVKRAQEGGLKADDGSSLPALLDLYKTSGELFDAWLKANGFEITTRKTRDQYLSDLGASLGDAAGRSISLSSQVKGGASERFALK